MAQVSGSGREQSCRGRQKCAHWQKTVAEPRGIGMQYEGGEQCKVCGHVLQALQVPAGHGSAMPTEVLPSFLYAGSYDHASRSELLKAIGITHILSVSICPNFELLIIGKAAST